MTSDRQTAELLQGLPPVLPKQPRLLILGSMPGAASLQARQYYAHPRNAFWPIMMRLLGCEDLTSYADRIAALRQAGIALWDVLALCRRQGSLDQAIEADSEVANDIATLLDNSPGIGAVACNGQKASLSFRRHIVPQLSDERRQTAALLTLPSSSPAHAAMSCEEKLRTWRQMLAGRI